VPRAGLLLGGYSEGAELRSGDVTGRPGVVVCVQDAESGIPGANSGAGSDRVWVGACCRALSRSGSPDGGIPQC
jgi:hypothetical protein